MLPQTRRADGDETWFRLREWTKGQKAAERLAAHIIRIAGYRSIDPSHPLGGPDGLKDGICLNSDGLRAVLAVHFPRGQTSYNSIKSKLLLDSKGVARHAAESLVFVTNQELRIAERKKLQEEIPTVPLDLFHLERISSHLDSAEMYSIRLEYLGLAMSQEDMVSFFAQRDAQQNSEMKSVRNKLDSILSGLETLQRHGGGKKAIAALRDEVKKLRDAIPQHGHLLPSGSIDNAFDLGARTMRFRNGHFGEAVSIGLNAAQRGAIRICNGTTITGRNGSNSADLDMIGVDSSNRVQIGNEHAEAIILGKCTTGFFGSKGSKRQTIRGRRGKNEALSSLLQSLNALGLIEDKTTP